MQPRLVIDLDHTICIPNLEFEDVHRRYGMAEPMPEMIEILQKLHKKGFYIIIHTARGMLSCKGNIDLILERLERITTNWLNINNIPFDELVFGKPYGDYYVDDKSLSFAGLWDLCKS